MRIELVTQMWPSPENPELGSFLVPIAQELENLGHEVDVVAISRRGGSRTKYARLSAAAVTTARRTRPDVVFGHFVFPAGAAAAFGAIAGRAPLVVMAHGQDVANIGSIPGAGAAVRWVVRRSAGIIANSRWLAGQLAERAPRATGRIDVIDCGVDLERFSPADRESARAELGWEPEGPALLCVGSLIERKNVVALADAFAGLGTGSLVFVGDGPLRGRLEGRDGVRVIGRIPHDQVPRWVAACDVLCQPSLVEPFGQAALEAMAMQRSVVATRIGGPPEFVTPDAGVLVDPGDPADLRAGLERAIGLPSPNPAARVAAAEHDVRTQARRMAAVLERAASGQS